MDLLATIGKICRKCKNEKILDDFYDDPSGKNGKRATCKECHKDKQDDWRQRNHQRVLDTLRNYRQSHREELREKEKERYENPAYRKRQVEQRLLRSLKNPEVAERHKRTARNSHLKCKHGITLEQLEHQIEVQKNRCRVCTKKFTEKGPQKMAIHHCHVTGSFTGLLCSSCNSAEGMLKTPETALRMYEYMKEMELLSYQRPSVIVLTPPS